jgi:hypothetical protein
MNYNLFKAVENNCLEAVAFKAIALKATASKQLL